MKFIFSVVQNLPREVDNFSVSQEILRFYETRRFITVPQKSANRPYPREINPVYIVNSLFL
jgi:hypothetical protein